MRCPGISITINVMKLIQRLWKKILIFLIGLGVFLALFLDDIFILGAIIRGQRAEGAFGIYLGCAAAYVLLFLALPALIGLIFGACMLIRSVMESETGNAKAFGVLTAFQFVLFLLLFTLFIYLMYLLNR